MLVGQGLPRHRLVGCRAARPQDAHRLGKHERVAAGDHRDNGAALAQGRRHRDDLDLSTGYDLAGHNNLQRRRPGHKSTQSPKLATRDFANNLAVLGDLHRCLLKQLGRVDGDACGTAHGIARERRGGVDAQLNRLADRQGLRGDELENELVFLHVHALIDGTARRGGIRGAVRLLGGRVAKEADRVDFLVGKHDGRHTHGLGLVGHGVGIVARGVVHRALGTIPVCLRLHVPGVKRALYAREVGNIDTRDVGVGEERVAFAVDDAARAVQSLERGRVGTQSKLDGQLLGRKCKGVAPHERLTRNGLAFGVASALLGRLSTPGVHLANRDVGIDHHGGGPDPQRHAVIGGSALGVDLDGRRQHLALRSAVPLFGGAHGIHAGAGVLTHVVGKRRRTAGIVGGHPIDGGCIVYNRGLRVTAGAGQSGGGPCQGADRKQGRAGRDNPASKPGILFAHSLPTFLAHVQAG